MCIDAILCGVGWVERGYVDDLVCLYSYQLEAFAKLGLIEGVCKFFM